MITGSLAAGWLVTLGASVPFLVMFAANVGSVVAAVALVRWVRSEVVVSS